MFLKSLVKCILFCSLWGEIHAMGSEYLISKSGTLTPLMQKLLAETQIPFSTNLDEILERINKKWNRNAEHRQDTKKEDLSPQLLSSLEDLFFTEIVPQKEQKHYNTALIFASTFNNVLNRLMFALNQGFSADTFIFLAGRRTLYAEENFAALCQDQHVLGRTLTLKSHLKNCERVKKIYPLKTEDEMVKFLWEAFDWQKHFPSLKNSKPVYIVAEKSVHSGRRPTTADTLIEGKKYLQKHPAGSRLRGQFLLKGKKHEQKQPQESIFAVSNQFYARRQFGEAQAFLDPLNSFDLIAKGAPLASAQGRALDILNEFKVIFWLEYYGVDYEKAYRKGMLGQRKSIL